MNAQEAMEEALFTANLLDKYKITFPVAYDCEGFKNATSRAACAVACGAIDMASRSTDIISAFILFFMCFILLLSSFGVSLF